MSGVPSSENLNLKGSFIVKAGAGAGKTTALIARFIDYAVQFKAQHKRWPRIVLTTFTKKATHEIRERLFQKAFERKDNELFEYINSPSMVQITTIHGLLSSFLAESGLEMGLRPQLSIGDERLLDQERRSLLRKLFLQHPEWSQVLEIWRFSELLHILEDWSSVHIQNQGLAPWSVESMKQEMTEALLVQAGQLGNIFKVIASTTQNASWTEYCEKFPKDLQKTPDQAVQRLQDWVNNRGRKPQFRKDKPPFEDVLNDRLKDSMEALEKNLELRILEPEVQAKMAELHQTFDPLAQAFAEEFLRTKLEKGLLSFDDLETFSLKMMREFPDHVQSFSKHWDFWLIDEYQDTSPLQVELLRTLIADAPHYVVGDPQQSIYLFRGARVEVFDAKIKEMQDRKQTVVQQMTNYRSRKEILDFINFYFSSLGQFSSMQVGSSLTHAGSAVDVVPLSEGEEEAAKAKDYIIQLLLQGKKPESICVLSATHLMLENLGIQLAQAKVDYQIHSHGKFFQRDEVVDALAILKFLVNPHDNKNLVSVLRAPWFHLEDGKIQQLCRGSSYWAQALRSSFLKDKTEPNLVALQDYISRAKQWGIVETFKQILLERDLFKSAHQLDNTGLREANLWKLILHLGKAEKAPGFSVSEYLRRIEENENLVEGEMEGDAAPFIEPQKVQMMTIHASKGLQFDHVVLLGYGRDQQKSKYASWAFEGKNYSLSIRDEETGESIPSWMSHKQKIEIHQREEEEYLRLLYVAFTRAKDKISFFPSAKPRKSSWQSLVNASWQDFNIKAGYQLVQVLMDIPVQETLPGKETNNSSGTIQALGSTERARVAKAESVTSKVASAAKVKGWGPEVFRKIQKGVDFHSLVEAVKYGTETENLDPSFAKALQFVKDNQEVPLQDLIRYGFVEWGFTVKWPEGPLVRGQIDLWSWYNNQLWVLDYKTGKSGEATETAFQQVQMYAEALGQIFPQYRSNPVQLVIVYPFEEKISKREYSFTSK